MFKACVGHFKKRQRWEEKKWKNCIGGTIWFNVLLVMQEKHNVQNNHFNSVYLRNDFVTKVGVCQSTGYCLLAIFMELISSSNMGPAHFFYFIFLLFLCTFIYWLVTYFLAMYLSSFWFYTQAYYLPLFFCISCNTL